MYCLKFKFPQVIVNSKFHYNYFYKYHLKTYLKPKMNKHSILLSCSAHNEGLLSQLIKPSHEIRSQVVSGDAFETHEDARCKQVLVLDVLLCPVHQRRMLIPDVKRVLDNLPGSQTVENRLSASLCIGSLAVFQR